ncbi:GumC family protein [Novosphingobium soli]|uniref:non-specific protein-tyrosine kinase n=1 Tax=Novosphingobium soli TaxID=574956 RepID=A0ABV6CS60_9SPHN
MSNRTHETQADEISVTSSRRLLPDPLELTAALWRRRWVFTLAFVATLTAALATLAMLPRTYTATSALLLEPRQAEPVKVNDRGFVAPADDNLIDTAVQIIRSPNLVLDVVRSLRLDRSAEFGGSPDAPGAVGAKSLGSASASAAERRAAGALLARTSVRRVGVTYLVEISVSSADAELAARIANSLARRYIALDGAKKQTRNAQAARYVESQAAMLRRQAVADDAALQRYMIRHNLMSAEGATMAEQEVSELNRQIADAQAQVAEQRGKLNAAQAQIARGGGGADISAALASETVRQLRQQEAQASASLAQRDARYGSRHPDVIQARDELADIRVQLGAELSRIVSGLRADVQVAESRLASLLASRGRAKGSLVQNSSAQVGRLELERRAEASRAIYNAYLTRAKETAQAGELPNADAAIASLARVPTAPSSPRYMAAAAASIALAILVGGLAAGIAEYTDSTIATRADVEGGLQAVYAGAIPTLSSASRARTIAGSMAPQDYVVARPMSLFTESFRNLATYLGLSALDRPRVVAITSPLPREGKSTTSMCLARSLATGRCRVVLVDGDTRHRSASNAFLAGEAREGLPSVLDGTLRLDQALVKDPHTALQVLPTTPPSCPSATITEDSLCALLTALKQRFDVVILDCPPVLGIAEARILARLADTTLVVAHWRRTPMKAMRTAIDLLVQNGCKIGGVALTRVNIREYASAGLTDAFGYYKKFKGYYVD